MSQEQAENALIFYKRKRDEGSLSVNLSNPTPAGLRDECEKVFKEKDFAESENVLRSFFGPAADQPAYEQRIINFDIDKFKPLINFMNEKVKNTNPKNIGLLLWLVPNASPVKKYSKSTPSYALIAIAVLCTAGLVIYMLSQPAKQCMYWNGNEYLAIYCDQKVQDKIVIALDTARLAHQRRMNKPDTLTQHSVGKVWYSKTDGKIEFYTAGGNNPIDERRRLLPMSQYIFNEYVVKPMQD